VPTLVTVGVTVYGHQFDPEQRDWKEDPIVKICKERLPEATVVPIRFGEKDAVSPVKLTH
jgi:hypothetical protein